MIPRGALGLARPAASRGHLPCGASPSLLPGAVALVVSATAMPVSPVGALTAARPVRFMRASSDLQSSSSSSAPASTTSSPSSAKKPISLHTVRDRVPESNGKLFLPYKSYLHTKYARIWAHSPWVAVVQNFNATLDEFYQFRSAMAKVGNQVSYVQSGMMRAVVRDTPYAAAEPLFLSKTCLVYRDPLADRENPPYAAIKDLLKFCTGSPKFLVLGAKVKRALLNHEQIKELTALPTKIDIQAELLGLLSQPAQVLTGTLSQPSQHLALLLDQHVRNLEQQQRQPRDQEPQAAAGVAKN